MMFRSTFILLSALALASCAANGDPAKGGFLSGVANLADGTYEKRIDDKQQALDAERTAQARQSADLAKAQTESADVRARRQAAERRYAAFDRDLKQTRARLAKLETGDAGKKAEAARLRQEIDALESKKRMVQQDGFTPDAEKEARLAALQKERDALDSEIEMLIRR